MGDTKPVIASTLAQQDIDAAADHYLAESGVPLALRFVDAVSDAMQLIGRQPGIGSPRLAHEVGIEGLRSWPLAGFPYLVLYLDHDDAVDVLRVLHGARDVPATLLEPAKP